MESRTTLSLKPFSDWLNWLEQFPLISGWQWTSKSWNAFSKKLTQKHIPHCRNAYGNVLLGAKTTSEWFSKIKRKEVSLILQAHLDHPGAIVMSLIGHRRYSAKVQGRLHAHLKGKRFFLYDRGGIFAEEVLIDAQAEGFKERWISFRAKSKISLPGYLRGPHQNSPGVFKEGFLEGWGMDDHAGCAAILSYFSQNSPENILGVLTLDEEIGFLGMNAFLRESKKAGLSIQEWPLLLSLEVTPEYPEIGFICGQGPRWRSADKRGSLIHPAKCHSLALKKGICEAGQWVRWGGNAACLAVPSEFTHNGIKEGEWRAERIAVSDIALLQKKMTEGIKLPRHHDRGLPKSPKIRIYDHLQPLREAAKQASNYVNCLQEVLPLWNELHSRFNLPAVKFAQEDWSRWRNCLLASKPWKIRLSKIAKECVQKVEQWCQDKQNIPEEIAIHLFASAPFNASSQSYGIGLSVEKLKEEDLRRVLIHEMTHLWTVPLLHFLNISEVMKTALEEGLACKATMDILNISCTQSLGFSEAQYLHYEENSLLLASYFKQWLHGDFFSIRKGRHEIIENKEIPHPFLVSSGGTFPKYGYFIGLKFVNEQGWLHTISSEIFEDFLCQMQKGF